jgi:hypothetical protein
MAFSRRGFFGALAAGLMALPFWRRLLPERAPRKAWIGHHWPRS